MRAGTWAFDDYTLPIPLRELYLREHRAGYCHNRVLKPAQGFHIGLLFGRPHTVEQNALFRLKEFVEPGLGLLASFAVLLPVVFLARFDKPGKCFDLS